MGVEVITKEDLQQFRIQLLEDIMKLVSANQAKPIRPWLKNSEVKELLKISSNTIQRLRISGKLQPTKIGGTFYYRYSDIEKLLDNSG